MTMCIVTTMLNEVDNLPNFVDLVIRIRTAFALDISAVLVDNGSTDNTKPFFDENYSNYPFLRMVQNPQGLTYADGIELALLNSEGDYALFIPSDMQFDFEGVRSVVSVFLEFTNGGSDLHRPVLSIRTYRKDGAVNSIRGWLWKRIVLGIMGFDRYLDPASQLRILCKDCLRSIDSRNFLWDIESLYYAIKYATAWKTVNVTFHQRAFGASSLEGNPIRTGLNAIRELFKIRIKLGTL